MGRKKQAERDASGFGAASSSAERIAATTAKIGGVTLLSPELLYFTEPSLWLDNIKG